jgi:hypothetical protein
VEVLYGRCSCSPAGPERAASRDGTAASNSGRMVLLTALAAGGWHGRCHSCASIAACECSAQRMWSGEGGERVAIVAC